jgi:flavin reductase (DIM6/NTAB) family NADH-FMN oxidoreductase RutF
MLNLDTASPIWDKFFLVAPLVVIGTRGENGVPDLAPKHMAGPVSWDNYFAFVCSPTHTTLVNVMRRQTFSVSYPRPDQVVLASLAASPCAAEVPKTEVISHLPLSNSATHGDPLLQDASLHLECRLYSHLEIGPNMLVVGQILTAAVHTDSLRNSDQDEQGQIHRSPLLAYLSPGRYATIHESQAFPFPRGYQR